ncbi:MAG: hypothetical protein AUJ85_04735 [Elusimicrobia bacterium CG1_02_37_114]|nr:MAG: hypothetical protein AUJ85_04735 [Elusimicrobia bacterium CG1_02_37_114]PIV53922.1 MAG: hypothetical protein COS17_01390 [Elusimicrobia bacterium CG02_land_8_20_14_3_00_37_13]PIZ13085.1 MAG: hypothetical protein COY53_06715 [Elusimicrobia bacterium CG_4_10_14_0_8_um_filter_37_32]
MAIIEVNIIPIGSKTASVSKYVARALDILKKEKNIKYQLGPMETVIEGDLDKILKMAKKMHRSIFDRNIKRVVTTIKIDERSDKNLTIEGKLKSVRITK